MRGVRARGSHRLPGRDDEGPPSEASQPVDTLALLARLDGDEPPVETIDPAEVQEQVGGVTLTQARTTRELTSTAYLRMRMREVRRQLVRRELVERAVQRAAYDVRDRLLVFPARFAGQLAAELGVDAAQLEQVLDRALREYLSDLAELGQQLTAAAAGRA